MPLLFHYITFYIDISLRLFDYHLYLVWCAIIISFDYWLPLSCHCFIFLRCHCHYAIDLPLRHDITPLRHIYAMPLRHCHAITSYCRHITLRLYYMPFETPPTSHHRSPISLQITHDRPSSASPPFFLPLLTRLIWMGFFEAGLLTFSFTLPPPMMIIAITPPLAIHAMRHIEFSWAMKLMPRRRCRLRCFHYAYFDMLSLSYCYCHFHVAYWLLLRHYWWHLRRCRWELMLILLRCRDIADADGHYDIAASLHFIFCLLIIFIYHYYHFYLHLVISGDVAFHKLVAS